MQSNAPTPAPKEPPGDWHESSDGSRWSKVFGFGYRCWAVRSRPGILYADEWIWTSSLEPEGVIHGPFTSAQEAIHDCEYVEGGVR